VLDDNIEIDIWSQNRCTADYILTTAERILNRSLACSCLENRIHSPTCCRGINYWPDITRLDHAKWDMTSLAKSSRLSSGMGSGNSKKK